MSTCTPFDVVRANSRIDRMFKHLAHHRADLGGVDTLTSAACRYVAELYPAGDLLSTDSTRTAVALYAFFTGRTDLQMPCKQQALQGAPCPAAEAQPVLRPGSTDRRSRAAAEAACFTRALLCHT